MSYQTQKEAMPIIRYDSDEAARKVTVTGWVSRSGLFYGDNEHIARWDGCTHIVCACGAVTAKGYTCCETCRAKLDRERWEARPLVPYNGGAFCLDDGDRYFFDADEFYEWCDSEELQPSTLMLVPAVPESFREVDADYWYDDLPEDSELPDAIATALETLNAAIRAYAKPACYRPGPGRIVMQDLTPEIPTEPGAGGK